MPSLAAFMPLVKCHFPLKSFQTHGVLRPLPFSAKMPVPSSTSKCYRKGFLSFTSYSLLSCKFGVHYHPLQDVGHSWRCYCSLIAQPLRSTMADDDSAYLGIAHQLNRSSILSKPLLWYLSNIVPYSNSKISHHSLSVLFELPIWITTLDCLFRLCSSIVAQRQLLGS